LTKGDESSKYVANLEKSLSDISEEVMRRNRNKMLSSVEHYITQEYTETIEKNLKRGELY